MFGSLVRRFVHDIGFTPVWTEQPTIRMRAFVRDAPSRRHNKYLRKVKKMVPGLVYDARILKNRIKIAIPFSDIDSEAKKRHFFNKVYQLDLYESETQSEPSQSVKGLVTQSIICVNNEKPMNVNFMLFQEGRRYRLMIPLILDFQSSNPHILAGAGLDIQLTHIPCVWQGDEKIPEFIYENIANMPLNKSVTIDELNYPPGLEFDMDLLPFDKVVYSLSYKQKELEREQK
jgi:hypothetical protein